MLNVDDASDETPEVAWPLASQASIGTVEDGILVSEPGQTIRPTASTAKLITVLTVLKDEPLALGEKGPTLTMDASDIALYDQYFAAGGSLVAVSLGEKLTQYQMIQGILIRSGNNLADSLAIWAFGSLSEYQKAAQTLVNELGMTSTTVGTDASGLSDTTTSTAEDLTRLGIAAMKHDVVREIVGQSTSNLPVDGIKPNTNWLLGQDGVVGIKTGNIPAVGGVFIIAKQHKVEGQEPITLVSAVQGEPTTAAAIAVSNQLTESIKNMFVSETLVKKGTIVAKAASDWGESTDIVTRNDLQGFGWKYRKLEPKISLLSPDKIEENDVIGSITIGNKTTELIAKNTINEPSWQWRLLTSR